MDIHAPNPIHDDPLAHPDARWDRRNTGEGAGGVATPMTASWSRRVGSAAQLRLMHLLGAIDRSELGGPDGTASPYHERLTAHFYGRRCLDATATLGLLGRLPGVDAGALSEQIFGERLEIHVDRLPPRRSLEAIARVSWLLATGPRRIRHRAIETRGWWSGHVAESERAPWGRARALLDEAVERFRQDMTLHISNSIFHTGMADAVNKAVGDHLDDEHRLRLHGGTEEMSETAMLDALHEAGRTRSMADFTRAYGFYAPDENELMTRSWREDASGLDRVLDGYHRQDLDPAARHRQSRDAFAEARRRFDAAAPLPRRLVLSVLLRGLRRFAASREQSKAMTLQCTDAARAAVRRLGVLLADAELLDDPDDVFFLTIEELEGAPERSDLGPVVAERRVLAARYHELQLPFDFRGPQLRATVEDRLAATGGGGPPTLLEGLGVSAGVATGRAVVMRRPEPADLEVGDVLVCETTDPGWSALLSIAGAVVMDMGSTLSHGAIVARELGIPCVSNLGDATRTLRTGQVLRVDGTAGRVAVEAEVATETPDPRSTA